VPDDDSVRSGRGLISRLRGPAGLWWSVFCVALGGFLIRFLVPVPVGQADNRDGPRLMCGLGVTKLVPHGLPHFFRYAYFEYVPSKSCSNNLPYPSSEIIPLELAKLLTPLFRLPGTLNLIALGVLMCVIASAGIASLAAGLRVRPWARMAIAAIAWVIVADAAFFDVFASPFSEPATMVGLVLVAAGVLYLGRGWRSTVIGLWLAGIGGFLAILSKEQYLTLAFPICLTIALASTDRTLGRWRKFKTREAVASLLVAALLGALAFAYWVWQDTSHYGLRLQHIQVVDMIFTDIVTKRATAPAELRSLGLPTSWARYAGHYYWDTGSVRTNPLYSRYEGRLMDTTIAHYLVTHPSSIFTIGQSAAILAQRFRVTSLGDYAPSAHLPGGSYESRVVVLTWLVHQLPSRLGLWLYVPLWLLMTAIAVIALTRRRRPWHRDGAVLVLCMTGSAFTAFIPPAYFAGISTTRHMVGANLSTAFAFTISAALVISMIYQAVAGVRQRRALHGDGGQHQAIAHQPSAFEAGQR
jgi:hypothetical protein